ncbi:MAG: pantoate--beta-alanine ligase [Elusimicrobiota bacterium]
MEILTDPRKVQNRTDAFKEYGDTVGLVPTMGALHVAHESLIKKARRENDRVIVSIFVNPTQFGPGEDLDSYPRNFEKDSEICKKHSTDIIFNPEVSDMYKNNHSTEVKVSNLTSTMCGARRPGHFEGVATVVSKLFNIAKPHRAYFGQKDYQQFRVIERMVRDLNFDIDLVMCPIVREKDGLAVSSRNRYLDDSLRKQAPHIYKALSGAKKMVLNGIELNSVRERLREYIEKNIPDGKIDYANIYDARTLKSASGPDSDLVAAAAVWLGKARLIDNVYIKVKNKSEGSKNE